jgi:hypothetical protein
MESAASGAETLGQFRHSAGAPRLVPRTGMPQEPNKPGTVMKHGQARLRNR